VCLSVIEKPHRGGLGPLAVSNNEKKTIRNLAYLDHVASDSNESTWVTFVNNSRAGSSRGISCCHSVQNPSSSSLLPKNRKFKTGPQMFQKPRSRLKILGVKRMTRSKFHIEDPQILDDTVENIVARAT
jgi:hypothetical protein